MSLNWKSSAAILVIAFGLALPAVPAMAQAKGDHAHSAPHADAAGGHGHDHGVASDETAFGRPGKAKKVQRTVRISMSDAMRFSPAAITVRKGDTVRFEVRNFGKQKHEFVLGTMDNLKEHAEAMRKHPDMEHAEHEDHAVNLGPGKRGVVVWQFTKAGEFFFGCLIPGHFEAGMIGTVNVR